MVRIALGQVNTTVGDLDGNVELMVRWAHEAAGAGADLVCFPELAITGYPPEDLVLRPEFVRDNLGALEDLTAATAGGSAVLVGFVDRSERGLHNAAALLSGGEVVARYHKMKLPNYGVFDEARTFVPGDAACPIRLASSALGISVCEDARWPGRPWTEYEAIRTAVIPNINSSPYHMRKTAERLEVVREAPEAYPGPEVPGSTAKLAPPDADRPPWPEGPQEVHHALALGLGDYVRKNGFGEVVLGLSGGIDSALVATLATDALGPGAVRALAMPSPYSSEASVADAREVARRQGFRLDEVPIDDVFAAYRGALGPLFGDTEEGVAEENLQARIRGNLLMALSNKFGSL